MFRRAAAIVCALVTVSVAVFLLCLVLEAIWGDKLYRVPRGVWAFGILFFVVLDSLVSYALVRLHGVEFEIKPIARMFIRIFGAKVGYMVQAVVIITTIIYCLRFFHPVMSMAIVLILLSLIHI